MKARTIGIAIAFTWAVAITLAIARIAAALDTLASRPEPRPPTVVAAPTVPRQVPTSPVPPNVAAAAPSDVENSREQEQARQQAEEVLGRMQSSGQVDDDSMADFREAVHSMQSDERMELLGAFAVAVSRGEIEAGPEDLARVLP